VIHSVSAMNAGHSAESALRKPILSDTPLTGVGRFPNLAGCPAGPATAETPRCCRVHNHA